MSQTYTSKKQRGSIILNLFAVSLTILPVVSMGWWTYQFVSGDQREVVNLADVRHEDSAPLFSEPLITLTFDDGWQSVYTEAAPLFSKYDVQTTQYILPGEFASPNYLSVDQAKSMKDAGHEVTSHTYTHAKLTTLDEKGVTTELDNSLKVLRKFDLLSDDKPHFAAPNGETDAQSIKLIKERFGSSRNVMGDLSKDVSSNDINVPKDFDRYNIIGYTVGQYTTDDQLRQAIAFTKANNGWFVPIYHQVDNSGDKYSVSSSTLERHLTLYKASGIKIVTMREALEKKETR